jgi:hypothetical protein
MKKITTEASIAEQEILERSLTIDAQLKCDRIIAKDELRIPVFGYAESGRAKLVKNMKIRHRGGFSEKELLSYRPAILQTVVEAARWLVRHTLSRNVLYEDPLNEVMEFTPALIGKLNLRSHFRRMLL